MILNPAARDRILSGGQYTIYEASITAKDLPEPWSLRGSIHWVSEQLNIKAETGACKLIDGCSLALRSATVSVVSAGICHRNEVNSTAWPLSWWAEPSHKKVSFALHYTTFTLHYNIYITLQLAIILTCIECTYIHAMHFLPDQTVHTGAQFSHKRPLRHTTKV